MIITEKVYILRKDVEQNVKQQLEVLVKTPPKKSEIRMK
jgi:hypothetical protein